MQVVWEKLSRLCWWGIALIAVTSALMIVGSLVPSGLILKAHSQGLYLRSSEHPYTGSMLSVAADEHETSVSGFDAAGISYRYGPSIGWHLRLPIWLVYAPGIILLMIGCLKSSSAVCGAEKNKGA